MAHDPRLIEALQAKANVLRIHSIRSTSAAGSGHPTSCMSAAEIMSVLFFHVMKWDPKNPGNRFQDRFVLSKGHAAPVLYAAWAEAGVFPVKELLTLRDINSPLEGHPTPRLPFVDVATGSLGQGLSAAVGLALNSRDLDRSNYRTFVLLGDGEAAEGSVWEGAQMAGNCNLENLVAIVDCNRLGQSQATAPGHHVKVYEDRFKSFGWNVVTVDGHDVKALIDAFEKAEVPVGKPFAIIAKTVKGKGVTFAADENGWHGKPFKKGEQEEEAIAEVKAAGIESSYKLTIAKPAKGKIASPRVQPMSPPEFKLGEEIATREAFGQALAKLGTVNSTVVALDADTKNSTFSDKFMKAFPDRFYECYIAEQNMVSTAAGLSSQGKIPFASTFAVFLSRGFDQIRMAGISGSNVKFCGSHVGISIGEDGPSQMGLEDLAMFRAMPGCAVFYPSDAVSAEWAVALAAEHQGMAYIRTSRPKTPVIYKSTEKFAIGRAKVVRKSSSDVLTIATGGVTLFEAFKAADKLEKDGIHVRVIDLFTIKPIDRTTLLRNATETGNRILTVEDHYPEGGIGEAVSAALSDTDVKVHRIAVQSVPKSGAPDALLKKFGIDSTAIVRKVKSLAK